MAIDAAKIAALIDELGLEGEDSIYLANVLKKNEKAATQFAGQRERHDQFTRRTQELSTKERELEGRVTAQVSDYARQLAEADDKIRKILTDFEAERISRATAEARVEKVKVMYNLGDDDLPPLDPPAGRQPNGGGNGNGGNGNPDIERMLSDFKTQLLKELGPELAAFPRVSALQTEIFRRHRDLTGKDLSLKEMQTLMDKAQAPNGPTLQRAWEDEYKIGELEETRRFDARLSTERQKWDDELKRKNSEDAMRGVRPGQNQNTQMSPVFRDYNKHTDGADRFAEGQTKTPVTDPNQGGPKLTGAERAAAKFMERRAAGIPMGKEAPVGANR